MLAHYSNTLDSRYNISSHEARINDVAKDRISSQLVEAAVESEYSSCFSVTELVRRFPEAFLLVEEKKRNAASSDSANARDALGVTHLHSKVLSSAKNDLLQ